MVNGGPGCKGARDPGNGAIGEVSSEVEEIGVQIGAALVECCQDMRSSDKQIFTGLEMFLQERKLLR
jgi:hypothetical protein